MGVERANPPSFRFGPIEKKSPKGKSYPALSMIGIKSIELFPPNLEPELYPASRPRYPSPFHIGCSQAAPKATMLR
jgi:hypothetical protein